MKERGIDFVPTKAYLEDLRVKGTKQEVLYALCDAAPNGLTKEDILRVLKSGTKDPAIAAMVERRGIAFMPSDDDFDELRAAGAGDALYKALQKARAALAPPEDKTANGVTPPVPTYEPEPHYSKEARKAKFSGLAVVSVIVDAEGNVSDARVVKPVGYGLDEIAVKTVKTWKFKPAMRDGVPVPVRILVEVAFAYDQDHVPPPSPPPQ